MDIHVYIHIYIYMYNGAHRRSPLPTVCCVHPSPDLRRNPYKYCFSAKLYCGSQSSVYPPPPPTSKAYPIAILLHAHCAIYAPPTEPPFVCHAPYNIGDGNIV